jgi:hypothetical protein
MGLSREAFQFGDLTEVGPVEPLQTPTATEVRFLQKEAEQAFRRKYVQSREVKPKEFSDGHPVQP